MHISEFEANLFNINKVAGFNHDGMSCKPAAALLLSLLTFSGSWTVSKPPKTFVYTCEKPKLIEELENLRSTSQQHC